MPEYNAPMFGLYAQAFLLYRQLHGEAAALEFFRSLFAAVLGKAYGEPGKDFEKGNPKGFKRLVEARDSAVGLKVRVDVVSPAEIRYVFETDPFPMLRGHVDGRAFYALFMDFKTSYLLGGAWKCEIIRHAWDDSGGVTEAVIRKIA